jgi:hypothetical protein
MMAVAILSIIVGLIYGSIAMTADSKTEVEDGNDIYQQARWALDKLDSDLQSGFISKNLNTHSIFYAMTRNGPEGLRQDVLHFTSFSHVKYNPTARESDQSEISYFVVENPETGLMTLYRREDPTPDEDNLDGGEFYDLVDSVLVFELHYYDGEQWVDEWDSRDLAAMEEAQGQAETEVEEQEETMVNTLPMAVDVLLVVAGPRESQVAFHTKIRVVLSTINLSALESDDDEGGGATPGGQPGAGGGSTP